jgi:hypothetical protein
MGASLYIHKGDRNLFRRICMKGISNSLQSGRKHRRGVNGSDVEN